MANRGQQKWKWKKKKERKKHLTQFKKLLAEKRFLRQLENTINRKINLRNDSE